MLTRESARRIVHLINFTYKHVSRLPKTVRTTTHEMAIHFLYATNSLLKVNIIQIKLNNISCKFFIINFSKDNPS